MKVYRVRKWCELHYFPAEKLGSGEEYKNLISGEVISRDELAEVYELGDEDTLTPEGWEYHFG